MRRHVHRSMQAACWSVDSPNTRHTPAMHSGWIMARPCALQARAHELQEAIASLSVSVECEVEQLPPLQRAQCECVCIQAALALASWLHSLHGEASDYVDVLQAERTMLAAYEKKVQAAVAKQELGRKKRGVEINVDAAHRFITHAIPDLSAAQKAELQQVRVGTAHVVNSS